MSTLKFWGRLPLGLTALAMVAMGLGCSHNPLVGKWTASTRGFSQEMQFNGDGTWSANMMNGRAVMGGKYTSSQDTLTLTQTSATINGISRPTTPQMSGAPQAVKYTLNGDKLTLHGPRDVTFSRSQ